MPEPSHKAVGIDLGTTYSAIAYLDERNKPVVIPNKDGQLTTPSVVLFDADNVIIGDTALAEITTEPDKGAQFVKRHMGDKWSRVFSREKETPETLSAYILRKLKQDAEDEIGPIEKAVITVPAYFNDAGRIATRNAGKLAGIEVSDIINEPTAAALAYGLDKLGMRQTVLVYDLGGGTFDVTIMRIEGKDMQEIATGGNRRLGGMDWDKRIIEYVAEEFVKAHGANPMEDDASMQTLTLAAEAAKRTLTNRKRARMRCNHAGKTLSVEMTREKFEEITSDLLNQTRLKAKVTLDEAKSKTKKEAKSKTITSWDDIDRVLLVGGSTHMPMVKAMLRDLTGKEPDNSLPPAHAVAQGAAIYAGMIQAKAIKGAIAARPGGPEEIVHEPKGDLVAVENVYHVSSHGLGIQVRDPKTGGYKRSIIIPKNTRLPCEETRLYKTAEYEQRFINVNILEGDIPDLKACVKVGVGKISSPSPLPKGAKVEVSIGYEEDGTVSVRAKEMMGHEFKTELKRETTLCEEEITEGKARIGGKEVD